MRKWNGSMRLRKAPLEGNASMSIANNYRQKPYHFALKKWCRETMETLDRYGRMPMAQISKDLASNPVWL